MYEGKDRNTDTTPVPFENPPSSVTERETPGDPVGGDSHVSSGTRVPVKVSEQLWRNGSFERLRDFLTFLYQDVGPSFPPSLHASAVGPEVSTLTVKVPDDFETKEKGRGKEGRKRGSCSRITRG